MAGRPVPGLVGRRYRRWRFGPGSCKADYLLSGPVPWTAEACRRAGTVHLGGTFEEISAGEAAAAQGRLPQRPYVLVAQPSVADPSRAEAGQHVLWAYCHVPHGSPVDASDRIEAQLDRFAPGWRDLVLHRRVRTAPEYASYNPNLVGGDIGGGSMGGTQLLARPVPGPDPYRTPIDGVWLCSSSTAPGGGVHGMCGWNAAASVLRHCA
jgi:phytoene dehydrogenase-like protein